MKLWRLCDERKSTIYAKIMHGLKLQEAQLSPSDRAIRLVSSNLPIATQQCRNYIYDKSYQTDGMKLEV